MFLFGRSLTCQFVDGIQEVSAPQGFCKKTQVSESRSSGECINALVIWSSCKGAFVRAA
jgi:hypothetical protein